MKTNYFEMVEKANTHNKAMKLLNTIETNNSDGSKAIAYLFYKIKNDKLYNESSFKAFIENHASDLKNYSQSTIYNYATCYEYVISKECYNELSFTQCYELTKAIKNGNSETILNDLETIKPMTIKDLKEYCKQFKTNGSNDISNQLETNNNNDISIKDSILAIIGNCEKAINKQDKKMFEKEWKNLKKFVEMIEN